MTKNPWRDLVSLTDIDALHERINTPSYWPEGSACSELVKEELSTALRAEVITGAECIVMASRLYAVRATAIADFLGCDVRTVNRAFKDGVRKLKEWPHRGVTTVLVETFGRSALDVLE